VGLGLLWWRTKNIHRQTEATLQQAATAERRHQAQVEADRERRITDNFTRAAELLGSDKLETRLGAIYALERIARESQEDHWSIMETLTAYVRERSPRRQAPRSPLRIVLANEQEEVPYPPTDVYACLTVIGRRRREYDKAGQRLKLAGTDLRCSDLADAHLERAFLIGADLELAYLIGAHLEGALLFGAYLEGASLRGAHFSEADLAGAHLQGADLGETDITQEQFDSAISDEHTQLPPHIQRRAQPCGPAGEAAEDRHELTAAPKATVEQT
jgi:Pentapeptide repeats (8 copies)